MDSGGAYRKRGRFDAVANGNGAGGGGGGGKKQRDMESLQSGLGSKLKPCTKFFSTSGCSFGQNCHFSHYVPGGIKAIAPTMANHVNPGPAPSRNAMGPLGNESSSFSVKSKLCNKYNTAEGCKYGDTCHFAHGERELGRPVILPHGHSERPMGHPMAAGRLGGRMEPPPPMAGQAGPAVNFGASATAKISVDATLAGAIIGKGGANTKQICRLTGAKVAIRDHESDPNLRNIELEGTFEQIGQASTMVKELIVNISSSSSAAGPAPAPPGAAKAMLGSNYKTKICDHFEKGTCTFGDRCHFAHGENELRKSAV